MKRQFSMITSLLLSINLLGEKNPENTIEKILQEKTQAPCLTTLDNLAPDLLELHQNLMSLNTKDALTKFIQKNFRKPHDILGELDEHSIYYQNIQKLPNKEIFHNQERLSLYSGASEKNIRLFTNQKLELFSKALFYHAIKLSKSWNRTKMSRTDLFHTHAIWNKKQKDILFVFHAKEYPNVILEQSPYAFRLIQEVGEHLPAHLNPYLPNKEYTRRNFVWSLKHQKICGIDTTLDEFKSLQSIFLNSTLDESKLRSENKDLFIINYFPKEKAPIFVDTLGHLN